MRCEGDLAAHYRSVGWGDADADPQQVEATPEKPKVMQRRATRKPRS